MGNGGRTLPEWGALGTLIYSAGSGARMIRECVINAALNVHQRGIIFGVVDFTESATVKYWLAAALMELGVLRGYQQHGGEYSFSDAQRPRSYGVACEGVHGRVLVLTEMHKIELESEKIIRQFDGFSRRFSVRRPLDQVHDLVDADVCIVVDRASLHHLALLWVGPRLWTDNPTEDYVVRDYKGRFKLLDGAIRI